MDPRPSKAHIWTRCSAFPWLEQRVPPQPDSDPAREGTCAAWVAECVLKGDAHSAEDMAGETHANGWTVTPDMVNHVQRYIDMIKARGGVTTAESYVRLSPHIAGTLDCSTSAGDGVLHVDDLKYGYVIVEPDSPQLIIYGAAELKRLMAAGHHVRKVVLGIYQPRAYHHLGIYRTIELTPDDLWQRAEWIIARGEACQDPQALATPGDHCQYCPANTSCEALVHSIYRVVDVVQSRHQREMTGAELAEQLDYIRNAKALVDAHKASLESEAEARMGAGEHVPGWFMRPRRGHRKFKVPTAVVAMLTGMDATKTVDKTPAELEREGAPLDIMRHLSEAPRIAPKLDKMPVDQFAKVFAK